jgi:hypothetical protein
MTKKELAREARKQRRLEALGTNYPHCGMCPETRWQCMEKHHPSDHGRDPTTVLACRNCHRVLSDDQLDHPAFEASADPVLDSIGHFLLGLADMLRIIIEKLYAFGLALIERAAPPQTGAAL